MANNRELSFTNRDYNALEQELFQKVREWSEGKYTDFSDSDPGTILLKAFMKMTDMTHFYIDKRATEVFPERGVEKKNIRADLRSMGYRMRGYESAEVDVTITLNGPLASSVDISPLAMIDCDIPYVVKEPVHVDPGRSTFTFRAVQGEVKTIVFNISDIDDKGRLYLQAKDLSENVFYMKVAGVDWNYSENVYLIKKSGRYFHIDYDNNDETYIQFIPGYRNYLSGTSGIIEIKGLSSMGTEGNIANDVIKGFSQKVTDDGGNELDIISVTNSDTVVRGKGPESIDEAIINGWKNLRTMESLVTLKDYEFHCERFDGVRKALAVDVSVPEASISAPQFIRVYLAYEDYVINDTDMTSIIQKIKDEIYADIEVNNRQIRGNQIELIDGLTQEVGGTIRVYLKDSATLQDVISNKLQNAWKDFFSLPERTFGEDFRFIKIVTHLSRIHESILYIEPEGNFDYTLPYNYFPIRGTLNIVYE